MRHTASQKGFTLIETLVALGIFAFSITALISITARGVFDTNFVKNKFTASYLALEGAELVHNIRDSASIEGMGWSAIFADPSKLRECVSPKSCYIDTWQSLPPTDCEGVCPAINFNTDTGAFSYLPEDGINNFETIFRRTITIYPVNANEVNVVSTVAWPQGSEERSVSFGFNLLGWSTTQP